MRSFCVRTNARKTPKLSNSRSAKQSPLSTFSPSRHERMGVVSRDCARLAGGCGVAGCSVLGRSETLKARYLVVHGLCGDRVGTVIFYFMFPGPYENSILLCNFCLCLRR